MMCAPFLVRCAAIPLAFVAASSPGLAAGRGPVQRDVEGYATSVCLAAQASPFLKDQSDGWATNIVARSHGEIEEFVAVANAVKAQLANGTVTVSMREGAPATIRPMPIQYCVEIIDTPRVRAAIEAAMKRLAPDYRRAKAASK